MKDEIYMVFDVESIGLHGHGFAVGYVVTENGREVDSGFYRTDPREVQGTSESFKWIQENVVPALKQDVVSKWSDGMGSKSVHDVRERFWEKWMYWKGQGAKLAADVAWPVEANFLRACIMQDSFSRAWHGPYPLLDIASVRFAAGLDPLGTEAREPEELPPHHPLADARQSARLLIEAMTKLRG